MRSSVIARVIILGSIAILSTLFIQFYIIFQQQKSEEKDFTTKAVTALYNVARRLVKDPKQLPTTSQLIRRAESNYFVVNINDQINVNLLEAYLNAEFHTIGLRENFEYGIYDCDKNNMVYGKLVSFEQGNVTKKISKLPIYKEFTYYFGVRFTDRQPNPFYAYTWVSLALLFVTLLFFAYTLWVILKQRTLAEMQKDFIDNLTHEFKTPIAAVGISSDVLLQNEIISENPRLKQYAEIIKKQNQLLNTQVERVLQVARMEKSDFQINPEPIDTHEIILDLISSVEPRVKIKNGTITSSLTAIAPVIYADKIHFIHIIQNLLDNAIKYSQENIKIEVSTYNINNSMILKCADSGSGIPKEYQKKIFSRFYRVPTGNVHNVKGFGLGLHYVYQICKAHGWKIRVDSKVGVGTSLYIEIPK